MIKRNLYINAILPFINQPQIKVITGIRRSGKSSLLRLLEEEFKNRGVEENCILFINLESFKNKHLTQASTLYEFVESKITSKNKYYLLLDEIQEVNEWEKAINSFTVDFNVDIYITGSNSHLLSSELSTYLAGRYIEFPTYTLSYKEVIDFRKYYLNEKDFNFDQYLEYGGFPTIHTFNYTTENAYKIVNDIYSSVILRDTVQRYKIRDIELLERIIKFSFDNVGSIFSGKSVADYFKSMQRKVDINTVYNYLHALEGAYILHKVSRYDIKGKEILKTQEKYYPGDISLLHATIGFSNRLISGLLETIVFLELKRRNYNVYIGKLGNLEIDFIAEKQGEKIYYQVAYKLENERTIEREFGNLLQIDDQYEKYVISMDEFWKETVNGVKHLHITQFLTM